MVGVDCSKWEILYGHVPMGTFKAATSGMFPLLKRGSNFAIPYRRFERSLAWERCHLLLRYFARAIFPMFMRGWYAAEQIT
jgi:hypothetical protein